MDCMFTSTGLGFDVLNLYALPKVGEKLAEKITNVAIETESTALKGTAPLVGRTIGKVLYSFCSLQCKLL